MTRTLVAVAAVLCLSTPVHADIERGDTGPNVRQVQEVLKWNGYTIAVDGSFGPQTERAVRHWQRANGLEPDAIVGPLTAAALGIRGVPIQLTQPPAAPALSGCEEMQAYRIAAGLPEQFDRIGWRESRCRNEDSVRTFCCYGWWQNYISSHLSRQSAYRDRIIGECGVTSADDINSDTADNKRASACVTYVVWSISGMSPWAATS